MAKNISLLLLRKKFDIFEPQLLKLCTVLEITLEQTSQVFKTWEVLTDGSTEGMCN